MTAWKTRKKTAFALILLMLALLAVTVWLFVGHRPPMDRPGPPPGRGEMFGDFPGGPPPDEPFLEDFEGPRPMKPEVRMALSGILLVLMTLCTVAAVVLLRKPTPAAAVSLQPEESEQPEEPSAINFKTDYKTVSVPLGDIRYIESMSEYIKVYLDSQEDPLVVLYSLKRLEKELPTSRFMRIHRSYIVALNRIHAANVTSVDLDAGITLPVGESYRPAFRVYLKGR